MKKALFLFSLIFLTNCSMNFRNMPNDNDCSFSIKKIGEYQPIQGNQNVILISQEQYNDYIVIGYVDICKKIIEPLSKNFPLTVIALPPSEIRMEGLPLEFFRLDPDTIKKDGVAFAIFLEDFHKVKQIAIQLGGNAVFLMGSETTAKRISVKLKVKNNNISYTYSILRSKELK